MSYRLRHSAISGCGGDIHALVSLKGKNKEERKKEE
jgi:hypothetical protein